MSWPRRQAPRRVLVHLRGREDRSGAEADTANKRRAGQCGQDRGEFGRPLGDVEAWITGKRVQSLYDYQAITGRGGA